MSARLQTSSHQVTWKLGLAIGMLGLALLLTVVRRVAERAFFLRLTAVPTDVSADDCANQLLAGASDGIVEEVASALAAGANVNETGHSGWTPLMRAASHGHIPCCQMLLQNGAIVDAPSSFGWTALMLALSARQGDAASWLIEHGANVNYATSEGLTALMIAARNNDSELCHRLLASGAQLQARDKAGCGVLACAAQSYEGGRLVAELLQMGLDPNQHDDQGETPLMEAAVAGSLPAVRVLLDRGARIETLDSRNESALEKAMQSQNDEIVRFLLQNGARARRSTFSYSGRTDKYPTQLY